MDHKTIYTTSKLRFIEDDMTDQEMSLFHSDLEHWGSAQDAAQRGAIYLDRIMPDWYTRVTLTTLNLSNTCRCVLGQIFDTEAANLLGEYQTARSDNSFLSLNVVNVMAGDQQIPSNSFDTGFHLGNRLLGLELESTRALSDDCSVHYGATSFFGFDYTQNFSFDELTDAWAEQIKVRVRAAL